MVLRASAHPKVPPPSSYYGSRSGRNPSRTTNRPLLPRLAFTNARPFASESKVVCQCGAKLPEAERVVKLFHERQLRQLEQEVKCPELKSSKFTYPKNCQLADILQKISGPVLSEFPDVIHLGNHVVYLEAIKAIPKQDLGDLTGDHGKQLAKFMQDCRERGLLSQPIGSIIDVGGQNTSAVNLVSQVLSPHEELPSLIIDLNSLTPAVSARKKNIQYAIDDALGFITSSDFSSKIDKILTNKPNLMIFNNFLNVLKADDGWKTLEAAWDNLRSGDYLIISGLLPEHLENTGLRKKHAIDGIVEFHSSNGFYKSALAKDFPGYVEARLENASVLLEEVFKFMIETRPPQTMDVAGRRLLTLRKA